MPIHHFAAYCPGRCDELERFLYWMTEKFPAARGHDEQPKLLVDETLWTARELGRPLPDRLRRALEAMSGFEMGDVRVCFDSPWPARVGARAFACGTVIHLRPGAEDALAHEAWHVVQQKQGRVAQTRQVGGIAVNDDDELEHEADTMGRLAERVALRRDGRSAMPALRSTTIRRPVVQRTVTVGVTTYTSSRTDFENFCKHVTAALFMKLGDDVPVLFPADVMSQIMADFMMDNETFADDPALLREVGIRNVGYQVEASMRRLMVANMKLMGPQVVQMEELLAEAREQWARDQKATYDERHYKNEPEFDAAVKAIARAGKSGFIVWQRASYFPYSPDTPLGKWVLNRTTDYPGAMNCWEAVLYSLVRSGVAEKGYIIWGNLRDAVKAPAWRASEDITVTKLLAAVVKTRDYYWSVYDSSLAPADRRAHRTGWTDTECSCIPPDVKIPKGRLVIMTFGSHVAISTGKQYLIATDEARERFGTRMGHGILDLDSAIDGEIRTIRETTIEDMCRNPAYLKNILISPFPCIDGSYSMQSTETVAVTTLPTVQEAVQAFLDENQTKIEEERTKEANRDKRAIERTEASLRKLGEPSPTNQTQYDAFTLKLQQQQRMAVTNQKAIDEKWQRLAMKSQRVIDVLAGLDRSKKDEKEGTVKVPITFAYDAVDLYHGLVAFSDKT